jgi:hypothetical protein
MALRGSGMSPKYRYDHRVGKHRKRQVLVVLATLVTVFGLFGFIIANDLSKNKAHEQSGPSNNVKQVLGDTSRQTINESEFTMELPRDWKETGRKNSRTEHSISWQATKKNEDNRYLTIYIDIIPTDKAVNRLLPVTAKENGLSHGEVSDKCENFTVGGTANAQDAMKLKPAPSKFQQVDFICNLERIVDNDVGTGSNNGINTVIVAGPKGTHKYFFLYTDRNVQPKYSILYDTLDSFKAK